MARLAAINYKPSAAIQEEVYEKGHELGLPIEDGDIQVNSSLKEAPVSSLGSLLDSASQSSTLGEVGIDVSYAVPLRFPGFSFRLKFHFHAADRNI